MVTPDQAGTVCCPFSKPVFLNEIRIAAHLRGIQFLLCLISLLGQHFTGCSPHITPSCFFCLNHPFDQVQIILAFRIGKMGSVNRSGTDTCHHFREFPGIQFCSKSFIHFGYELFIRLVFDKAANQLCNKIRLMGIIGKSQDKQHLRLFYPFRKSCLCHLGFNGIHSIFNKLQLFLLFCRHLCHDLLLQGISIQFNVSVEYRNDSYNWHNDNNKNTEYSPAKRFQYPFVCQQGYRNLFQRRPYRGTHNVIPASGSSSPMSDFATS